MLLPPEVTYGMEFPKLPNFKPMSQPRDSPGILYMYTYIHIHTCIHIYERRDIYIYIYIYTNFSDYY